jgi:hypothetical protein
VGKGSRRSSKEWVAVWVQERWRRASTAAQWRAAGAAGVRASRGPARGPKRHHAQEQFSAAHELLDAGRSRCVRTARYGSGRRGAHETSRALARSGWKHFGVSLLTTPFLPKFELKYTNGNKQSCRSLNPLQLLGRLYGVLSNGFRMHCMPRCRFLGRQ